MKDLSKFVNEVSNYATFKSKLWSTKREALISYDVNTAIVGDNTLNIILDVKVGIEETTSTRGKGFNGWHFDFTLSASIPFEYNKHLGWNLCKDNFDIKCIDPKLSVLDKGLQKLFEITEPGIKSELAYQVSEKIINICSSQEVVFPDSVNKDIHKQMEIMFK